MTQRFNNNLQDLIIPGGGLASNSTDGHSDCDLFCLLSGTIDATKTYLLQVSVDNITWVNWTSDGVVAYVVPQSGLARTYPQPAARYIRVLANGAVTGAVNWKMQTSFYE